ncbi:unnamed protein product [Rotaria socialis]|uniref:G-protein coupled receptors family 1 profile domain-containing protein n=1 Tax=Rotaria socialis TaxID=392032 RepID=A0A820VYG9_9BILA|nr:unnamed protein product [Rotaria socialis]CAF4509162.1 unnamed protein product [Rotaria socialis]
MGTFYVADYNNHRIVRWFNGSTSGNVIMAEQGVGIGIPQVPYPYDLAFGRQGNLYVTELLNSRIQMFPIDKSSCVKEATINLIKNTMPSNSSNPNVDRSLNYIILFRLVVWGHACLALSLFGIVGNIITIIVLMSPSLRIISTNMYLIALSCSNILFLLIFIPSYPVRYLLGYSAYITKQPVLTVEILLTPIGLPIDRLISIKFPSKSKHILTKRVTLMTILFIYIFSIVYCTPYLLEQSYVPELKQCHLTNIVVFYISTNFLLYFVFGKKIRLTLIQYVSNIFSKHPQSTFTTINLQGSNVQKTIADDTYQSAYNENQITLSTM